MAMLSTWLRRDLQDPLRYFRRLEIAHFYRHRQADIAAGEMVGTIHYRTPLSLFESLVRTRPDLVQSVEPLALITLPYLLTAWAYARGRRVPIVVVSAENRPLAAKYGRIVAAALRALLRPYLRQADLVVYLNEGTRRNLLACGARPERLVRLMYGTWGVDLDEFSPDGPRLEGDGQEKMILFVGRMQRAKGVFDLVEAFARVAAAVPEASLLLVGAGADDEPLRRRIAELGLQDRARVAGPVLNRDLPRYFRSAAVFASPSITTRGWEEQIGMTNVQAMACGVPVVSTLSGAIPEYVPDGVAGELVPESDPAALADALLRLLRDDDRRAAMGRAARRVSQERYDAQRNIAHVEDTLLSLLRPAGPSAR